MHLHGSRVSSTSSFVLSRCLRNSVVGATKDNSLILNFCTTCLVLVNICLKNSTLHSLLYKKNISGQRIYFFAHHLQRCNYESHNNWLVQLLYKLFNLEKSQQNLESKPREIFEWISCFCQSIKPNNSIWMQTIFLRNREDFPFVIHAHHWVMYAWKLMPNTGDHYLNFTMGDILTTYSIFNFLEKIMSELLFRCTTRF